MSLRAVVLVVLLGCASSSMTTDPYEPQTANEKQLLEAKAKGELERPTATSNAWTYAGDRKDCFVVVGRRRFKTQIAACTKARGSQRTSKITGAGPAAV